MATIKLRRTNEFVNKLRDYQIYVDGQKIGTIANGETKDFQTTEGQHTVVAKIDWASSPEFIFNLDNNQTKHLSVGGFKNASWLMPVGILLIFIVYGVSNVFDVYWPIVIGLPCFIILVYYLSFGRKKYLTLKETNIQ